MAYSPNELRWLGAAKETAWATANIVPSYYIPFKDCKPTDEITTVNDDGIRGTLAGDVFNIMQTSNSSSMDLSGQVFPDSIGLLLMAMFGADTVAGSTTKTHTFKSVTTTQPPSLTFNSFDGFNMRQWVGHVAEELTFKWAEKAALEYSFKSQGKQSAVATTTTPSLSTTIPLLNWAFSLSLGGSSDLNLSSFELDLKRKLTTTFAANNSQAPNSIVAGALSATGKMTFYKADDTELAFALSSAAKVISLVGTQATTNYGITFTITSAVLSKPVVSGKDLVEVDVDFTGVFNSTDGGVASIVLTNAVAASY